MAEAAKNRLNDPNRPPWWLVTYELDPLFFDLVADEQYNLEIDDASDAVELALEFKWKASYSSIDFKKGWIVLKLGSKADAEKVVTGYSMYKYFTNVTYTPVYSATQAGIDLKVIWVGFKKFLRARF